MYEHQNQYRVFHWKDQLEIPHLRGSSPHSLQAQGGWIWQAESTRGTKRSHTAPSALHWLLGWFPSAGIFPKLTTAINYISTVSESPSLARNRALDSRILRSPFHLETPCDYTILLCIGQNTALIYRTPDAQPRENAASSATHRLLAIGNISQHRHEIPATQNQSMVWNPLVRPLEYE